MAAAVARKKASDYGLSVEVDSAGTHHYHVGERADDRARLVTARRGYSLEAHRARQIGDQDFSRFDSIFVMDRKNMSALLSRRPFESTTPRPRYVTEFTRLSPSREIPDPYYGATQAFEFALDLIEVSIEAWCQILKDRA